MPPASTKITPPWKPDLNSREWILETRDALGLTQTRFAELVDSVRDTEAKWERKNKPQEPEFTFARRIVAVAPVKQVLKFLGPTAAALLRIEFLSDPHRSLAVEVKTGDNAMTWHERANRLVGRLAGMDPETRAAALARFEDAIERGYAEQGARNPSQPDAELRPRVRPSST